jgi:hypothetical protein
VWRVVGSEARLKIPQFTASVDLTQPQLGVAELSLCGRQLAGVHLLEIHTLDALDIPPLRLQDYYVRGADLVACYEELGRDVRVQVYWRAMSDTTPAIAGLELIVSVQTDSLSSDPRLGIGSRIPAGEVLRLSDQTLLHRLAPGSHSYVQMIDSGDCSQLEVEQLPTAGDAAAGSTVHSHFRLFDDRLEKGVIRRARMRGVFVPGQGDTAAAAQCLREFARSELPLTV